MFEKHRRRHQERPPAGTTGAARASPKPGDSQSQTQSGGDPIERIRRLKGLHAEGLITDAEFEREAREDPRGDLSDGKPFDQGLRLPVRRRGRQAADRRGPARALRAGSSHLSSKDRGFLDVEVTPLGWFPIATYGRMLEVLAREEGGRDPAGLSVRARRTRRGAHAVGHLRELRRLAGGLGDARRPDDDGHREAALQLHFLDLPRRRGEVYEIVVAEARDYPEPARYTAEGFLRTFARARLRARDARHELAPHAGPDRISHPADVRRVRPGRSGRLVADRARLGALCGSGGSSGPCSRARECGGCGLAAPAAR